VLKVVPVRAGLGERPQQIPVVLVCGLEPFKASCEVPSVSPKQLLEFGQQWSYTSAPARTAMSSLSNQITRPSNQADVCGRTTPHRQREDSGMTAVSACRLTILLRLLPSVSGIAIVHAPPGWYLLFLLDQATIPSPAAWVHLS
jgi:hypothetical protein